ncbi:MAG TPA: LamG domain-containing protein, partial [Candidatus Limnocylindrales bacterium]
MSRRRVLAALLTVALPLTSPAPAAADYRPGLPPGVDPSTPVFAGSPNPVPSEPVAFDPSNSMLRRIFDADVAAGGDSYWFDRVLERPFLSTQDSYLYTRGRALYMYTHNSAALGFGGGYAYRERPTGNNQNLYTVTISDAALAETTADRKQYPSHWVSTHAAPGVSVAQRKFITHNNVAVTLLALTNTSDAPATRTVTVSSPIATVADGNELTGTVAARYDVTTVRPRLSADGFTAAGASLATTVTLQPGQSTTLKVQLGAVTDELADSAAEYARFRAFDAETAFRTHVREYNRWWVDNVPYIDVPDANVKKMSYYRTFLNRYNFIDANVPGNDYQFPVSIEGVLGYNNAIQLTQPMHMQDLKYFRDPLYSYGNWVSSGETSKCTAFTSNPGSFSWGNTYEQYIAREAWNAFKVHGGDRGVINNFAHYAECDIRGQLAKYDRGNANNLIEYNNGALTGNDADAVALQYYTSQISQDRTETAFWYSGARAAAEAYTALGDSAKAAELNTIADNIRTSILTRLWDDTPADSVPTPIPATRVPSQDGFGNAVGLNGSHPNTAVTMPAGIVSNLNDFTAATWVNLAATTTWSRVFDFGSGPNTNMFLTVNAGTGPRFAITTAGGGNEQRINPTTPGQLPTNQWIHLAVTLSGSTATLYLNGSPIGTNPAMTLRPSSMGNTTQNWIGKSQYADPGLNGTVDDFRLYDRALSETELRELTTTPNVAWYKFDETGGTTATDSSGNGRDATVNTPLTGHPGKVFKQRNVARDALVPWKDQQNFSPFTEGLVPNTDEYKQALRYYADSREFPIMPFYTANQRDKAEAATGSNNFSNINSTLQAQVFAKAIREYPSQYVTPQMYRRLLDWLTWV